MKLRQQKAHMQAAYVYASLSYCIRRQVGCVIVKDNRIISIGYNGTPPGEDNTCECENNHTKDSVIHAEDNAMRKIPPSEDLTTASMFVTTAPCGVCAQAIIDRQFAEVFYDNSYRTEDGIDLIRKSATTITQLSP